MISRKYSKFKSIMILFVVIITYLFSSSFIGVIQAYASAGTAENEQKKAQESQKNAQNKSGVTVVDDSGVKQNQVITITWDDNKYDFKAEQDGNDITQKLKNNLQTYSTNINKAAEGSVDGTLGNADIGWVGKIIAFQKSSASGQLIESSARYLHITGNSEVSYIKLDKGGYKFVKYGAISILARKTTNTSMAIYEFKPPTKALAQAPQLSGSVKNSEFFQACKKSGLELKFSYWMHPMVGKTGNKGLKLNIADIKMYDNSTTKIQISSTYQKQMKIYKNPEKACISGIEGISLGDQDVSGLKAMGESIKVEDNNKIVNRALDLVGIQKLNKCDDGTYTLYSDSSKKRISAEPFTKNEHPLKYDIGENKIYEYTGSAYKDVTDVSKAEIDMDEVYICNYMSSSGENLSTGNVGVVIRGMHEKVSYKYEGQSYDDLTGRRVIIDGTEGFNLKSADGKMVYSNTEKIKPQWYLSGNAEFKVEFDDTYGPVIYLNKKYADDSGLSQWINSERGQEKIANFNGDVERLKKGLSSALSLDVEDRFSWYDRQRLDDISSELEQSRYNKIYRGIFILCSFCGIMVIVYSVLLLVAFYIDIMNPFVNASLYSLMTKGKVMPLPTEEDVREMGVDTSGGTKYISHRGAWTSLCIGILAGIVLMNSRNIYILVRNTYDWVTSIF